LRIVIILPLPLDSLDPSVYLLEDGEIEFGSKVKPGEARGDETLEEAPVVGPDETFSGAVLADVGGHTKSGLLGSPILSAANPSPTKKQLDTSVMANKMEFLRTFIQKW
jgi:hypothetical protein